ncbi:RNase H domain-containing protein [Aspergillus sclerotiicarbonarius CBS 121057]|uniref:RNase H domain-containing protein n=1 Tax=Aspergillus sclerotiicarbonarius (strain CBS 121057 / IBT 28362) TaxID=1448318 RepID=A0A319F240_ASPSB|nr:RNase H domain-containing protein [Aspergillus sclerotiicarbonarius CBS 121057]
MPSDQKLRIFGYAEFNIGALCQIASRLRQNITCTYDPNQHPASGSFNWAVFLTFEDGVQWVLRSPHTGYAAMSMELTSKLLESEAATLKYVRLNSDIPVPVVHLYRPTPDNEIGIPFILMSKASGWSLGQVWKQPGFGKPDLATDLKAKVVDQLGEMIYKLSQLRFNKIGSLFEQDGIFRVDECLSRGHILHDRYSLEDVPRGPFTSEVQFFDSLIAALNQHAEVLPLSHHCFVAPIPPRGDYESIEQYHRACDLWNDFVTVGNKIDSSDNRLDYIVAANALQEFISTWRSRLPQSDSQSFPLYHPDLSVNNIYVDDDYNITCIIDWAFSSTVPEAMAPSPPALPQSRNELDQSLAVAFTSGFDAATPSETLQQSKCPWLLTRLFNFDSTNDYGLFSSVWEYVYGHERDVTSYFTAQRSLQRYVELYNDLQSADEPVEKTQQAERDYFRDRIFRHAVARKLTLVSQWKCQYTPLRQGLRTDGELFVTDSRLWKWVLEFMNQWESIY